MFSSRYGSILLSQRSCVSRALYWSLLLTGECVVAKNYACAGCSVLLDHALLPCEKVLHEEEKKNKSDTTYRLM